MQLLLEKVDELKKILSNSHHARIMSHRNPDGDAIGSMLTFAYICRSFNISYDIFIVDPIPENLKFLPNIDEIKIYSSEEDEKNFLNEHTDLVVFVDCGQINRVGELADKITSSQKIINIDHHISNTYFGHLNYVADISSTSELLFHILSQLNLDIPSNIAQALYAGIVTDTGCFQYHKTNSLTLKVASELLEKGVSAYNIYQSYPISWLDLLKNGLNKLELYSNSTLAIISFSLEDLSDEFDETNVILPIIASTNSIEVYVILKEKEDQTISASLRSKTDRIDVAKIAEVFGGGGHQKAAGCRTSNHSLDEFKEMIKLEILKHL